jgi:hypothetical protein
MVVNFCERFWKVVMKAQVSSAFPRAIAQIPHNVRYTFIRGTVKFLENCVPTTVVEKN